MKTTNGNSIYKLLGSIFSVVAVIMLAVGTIWLVNTLGYINSSVLIEGEISKITTELDGDGDTKYTAFVNYEYKNKEYKKVRLSEYTASMYEGKKVELYIDDENPSDVHMKSMVYLGPVIFFIIGAIFLIVGVIPFILMYKSRKKQRLLVESGMKIYGKVTDGYIDNTITVNGRHPYRLKCVYEEALSGQPVICISQGLWEEPQRFIGSQVLIYVDRNDASNYYVDLSSIEEGY